VMPSPHSRARGSTEGRSRLPSAISPARTSAQSDSPQPRPERPLKRRLTLSSRARGGITSATQRELCAQNSGRLQNAPATSHTHDAKSSRQGCELCLKKLGRGCLTSLPHAPMR
jgi:hypothetical protein